MKAQLVTCLLLFPFFTTTAGAQSRLELEDPPEPKPWDDDWDEWDDWLDFRLTGPYWGAYANPVPAPPRDGEVSPKPPQPSPIPPEEDPWNCRPEVTATPVANPGTPRPLVVMPWLQVVTGGPASFPGPGVPYLLSLPAEIEIGSAMYTTSSGARIPMSVTLIDNIAALPAGVVAGEGTWTFEWPLEDFIDQEGRFYLLRVDATLGTFFGCPADGCSGPGSDVDFNGDCQVDLSDLAIVLSGFGTSADATHYDGDTDGNGSVDLIDLANLLSRFGAICL